MKANTITTMKFRRLKRALRLPTYQVVGVLESLWQLTASSAPAGDIGRFEDEDIAAWLEWDGDESALVDALVSSGFLDECPQHRLVVHDWSEHAPTYVKGILARQQKQFVGESAETEEPTKDGTKVPTKDGTKVPTKVPTKDGTNADEGPPGGGAGERPLEAIKDAWNAAASDNGWRTVRALSSDRKSRIRKRLGERGWLDAMTDGIARGRVDNDARFQWQPDFDWLIANGKNAFALAEGKYHRRSENGNGKGDLTKMLDEMYGGNGDD